MNRNPTENRAWSTQTYRANPTLSGLCYENQLTISNQTDRILSLIHICIPYFTFPSMVVDPDGADATFGILELEGESMAVAGLGSGWKNSRTGLEGRIVLREANGCLLYTSRCV